MTTKSIYRKDIQVLRGLAVLAVVLFHANEKYFPLGYLGVDVFFVISGFVVTPLIVRIFTEAGRTRRRRFNNLLLFYRRRFFRLAPALALTLIISSVVMFFLDATNYHQRFARQGIATLLLLGNVGAYRYSGDYFAPNPNPLIHTWSLSVEEQIYLFLPLVLMVVFLGRSYHRKIATWVFLVITIFSLTSFFLPSMMQPIYSRAGIDAASLFSFYSPTDRVWQFALGGGAAFLLDSNKITQLTITKPIECILSGGMFSILFLTIPLSLKTSSLIASMFALSLILFRSLEVLPNFLTDIFEWVGDRSYSIYLVHMPLLYIARFSRVTAIGNSDSRLFQSLIAVAASIVLGSISYSKIENRFRETGKVTKLNLKRFTITVTATFIIPILFLGVVDLGSKYKDFGLDKNIPQPSYAGMLDPTCARDSLLGPPCTYLKLGQRKTALLIGDSHAGHISQAFVDAASSQEYRAVVWTHSGCPILFTNSGVRGISKNCIEVNLQMKKWVELNSPNVIIVSEFIKSQYSLSDLKAALLALKSLSSNLLVIENSPVFPDERDFMVARPIIMAPYEPPKSFPESEMQIKDVAASKKISEWASMHGIDTMNIDSLFCESKLCSRYSGGEWLYRDSDHLSVVGGQLTTPQLKAYLRAH